MPDYPYIYDAKAAHPVGPGGTRLRVFRRRETAYEEEGGGEQREDHESSSDREAAWRRLLNEAVEELNGSFRQSGVPFSCTLEEDDTGFCLRVFRQLHNQESEGAAAVAEEVEEEVVEPSQLPLWLTRIRSRLGLLLDEKA